MSNEDVKFSIGAEETGVAAVMAEVQEHIVSSVETIKGSLEGINAAFAKVQGAFIAFTAILAGGEAFKEAIETTVDMTKESVALGRQLGISATDASVLKVALASVFVTQDQYTASANKITLALKKHESAFHDLGVATRDSNGEFLSTQAIMEATNARLLQFREGTDRNVEGMKIYGKGWLDASATLRVTAQVMEEAKIKADALGLTVGQEQIEATNKYRSAMNDVAEVFHAVENVIGQALLPALTGMGQWFGDIGPGLVSLFRTVMSALVTVFGTVWDVVKALWSLLGDVVGVFVADFQAMFGNESLTTLELFTNSLKVVEVAFLAVSFIVQEAANFIGGVLTLLKDVIVGWAHLVQAALSLDWNGVKTAWQKGSQQIEDDARSRFEKIVSIAQESGEKINDAIMGDPSKKPASTPTAVSKTGETSVGGDEKQKNEMAILEARLAAIKANRAEELAAQGNFSEFSLQMDRDYWRNILATTKLSVADELAVKKKISADTLAIAKQGYEAEIAGLKAQESQFKGNLQAKLEIAQQYAARIAQAEGADSAKAKQAAGEVLAIQRELDVQKLAIAHSTRAALDNVDLAAVDHAQRIEEAQVAAGLKTNAQLIADEKSFEAQRFQIKLAGLQRDLAAENQNPDRNPAKVASINQQILALQTSHDGQMLALTIKASKEQGKYWTEIFSSMNSGFQSTIGGFLKGTATIGQTVKGLFQDIGNAVADTLAKMLANWLTTQIQQQIMGKVSSLANIHGAAALAGANAYASTAAIPVVGPELAPEAAATAYAGALSFGAAAVAERGYDIPGGVNPLVQAHAKEMILPAPLAEVIRGMAGKGAPAAPTRSRGPTSLQLALHPSAMRYSLGSWLQSEMARVAATT